MNNIESADDIGPLCDRTLEIAQAIMQTKERIAKMLLEKYNAVLTPEQLAIQLSTLMDLGQGMYEALHPETKENAYVEV